MKALKSFKEAYNMKKTLSVLLAVLLLFATFAVGFAVFADDADLTVCRGNCGKPHSATPGTCTCCLNCQNLDMSKVVACAKDENGVKNQFCCANCTGFYDCTCGQTCGCKFCSGKGDAPETNLEPVISEQTQTRIKDIFQSVIQKISEVFDRIFEVAFAIFNVK